MINVAYELCAYIDKIDINCEFQDEEEKIRKETIENSFSRITVCVFYEKHILHKNHFSKNVQNRNMECTIPISSVLERVTSSRLSMAFFFLFGGVAKS